MDLKNTARYILAGTLAMVGAEGCRDNNVGRTKPLTTAPAAQSKNPHLELFSEVFDDVPNMLNGDFPLHYRWDADSKGKTAGVAQMDSISAELGGKRVSRYKIEAGKLFLMVENDLIEWATDSNGDGTKDFVGLIDAGNKLAITDFSDFNKFSTDILSYDDAVQNAEFYTKEKIVDIDDFKVFGVGNTGLYQSLPGIGNVRADVIVRYKDGSVDILVLDTATTPTGVASGGDLDKLKRYFDSNPNGLFANIQVFVFTDNHTADVKNKLGTNAKELRRYVMDGELYR